MSTGDCERWMDLADRAAVGDYLTEADQAWLSHHASVCAKCSSEQQFYTSLRGAIGHPEMLLATSRASAPRARRASFRKPLHLGLALAAGVALVVGGGLVLRTPRSTGSRPSPVATAHVVLASGDAHLGLAPAEAGQRIPPGQRLSTGSGLACMGIAQSVEVCLDSASAAILTLGEPNQILVYLEKGTLMARLDHQPAGRKFLVRTASAELQAVGTRFSVHLAEDGNTRVRLYEGRLAVRATSRVATDLVSPVQASVAQDIRIAPISPAATGEDKPLAELVDVTHSGPGAALMLTSTPAGADVLLDNVAIGKTPLSVVLASAAHVQLSSQGYAPMSEWIEVGDRPRVERAFALAELAASLPSEAPSPLRHVVPHTSPDQLLAKAQLLRAHGQYKACAQLYRRLRSEFPGSEEARVSMVSLGELELVETKNPAAALEAFDAYLRLGGPLEREARFGKIRALRALDRREAADAETARFLRDYPASIHAATLRRTSYGR
jgi:ferric-dicitrate binding protein FerR (iron transport regulator)